MNIISRSAWGARYPDGFRSAPLPAQEVYLHHSVSSGTGPAAVRALEDIGQSRFGGGISYTFAVDREGEIFQGHSVGRQGAHTGGRNDISRAICLIGNYETQQMTDAQIRAVAWLLREGVRRGWWRSPRLTGGHRDAPGAATACPGRHAHSRISEINRLAASSDDLENDDMTPDERNALFEVRDTLRRGQANKNPPGQIWLAIDELRSRMSRLYQDLTPGEANQKLPGETYLMLIRLRGQITGLQTVVSQLADWQEIDLAAVEAAVERGVVAGLEGGTVEVDVNVNTKEQTP